MIFYKNNLLSLISNEQFELLDFKDWILVNDEGNDYLKKWIKYKAGDCPDADEVLKINDDEGCILVELGWFKFDVKKKEQYIDCIFSMTTFFKAFLRFYLAEHEFFCDGESLYFARLFDNYDDLFGNEYKRKFCSKHNVSFDEIKKLFKQINLLARNTHTIGNYMPCPDNKYNRLKSYQCFKDRLELLYLELQKPEPLEFLSDRRDEWKKWFNKKNIQELFLEEIFETKNTELLNFNFNKRKMDKGDIIPYTAYLQCVNDIIKTRGNKLAKKLR